MSSMARLRPIIQRIVNDREDHLILAEQWAASMPEGSDVTADAILLTIAELRKERDDIETIRARPENEDVGQ